MKSKKQQQTPQRQLFQNQKSNQALKTLSWGLNNKSRSRSNELKNSFVDDFERRITRQFKSKILSLQTQDAFDNSLTLQSLQFKNDAASSKNLFAKANGCTILTRSQKTQRLNNNIIHHGRKYYHPSITTADTFSNYDQCEDYYSNKTTIGFNKQNPFLKESMNESQYSTVNYNNQHCQQIYRNFSKSVSQKERISFSLSSINNSKSTNKQSDDKDRSQDEDHYNYKIGQVLNKKFQILRHLGDGTFGRVLEVKNLNNKQIYAAKVIRAVERYTNSAKQEAEVLYKIKKLDQSSNHIVNIQDSFMEKDNFVMIFEKLGSSLYDFMKENSYLGYPIQIIQQIFKQTLQQVNFLHQNCYTHTDLKPENILFVCDKKIVTFNRDQLIKKCQIPSDYEVSPNEDQNKMFLPLDNSIKLIDLGNVTHENEHHSTTINTRQYRAPEVILGCQKWDELSDLWSIGCIILEIYNGDLFFETHENYEHIAMIEQSIECIPYEMAVNANEEFQKHFCFNQQKQTRKRQTYFDWPKHANSSKSIRKVHNMKTIDETIDPKHNELADLLKKILRVDPQKRLSCIEALQHPFFKKNYGPLIIKENYE